MALVLMEVDLTIMPVDNFFKILFLNLFSLVFSVYQFKIYGLNYIKLYWTIYNRIFS